MICEIENHFLVFYMKRILHMFWNSINAQKNSKQKSKIPSHMKFRAIKISVISNKSKYKRTRNQKNYYQNLGLLLAWTSMVFFKFTNLSKQVQGIESIRIVYPIFVFGVGERVDEGVRGACRRKRTREDVHTLSNRHMFGFRAKI